MEERQLSGLAMLMLHQNNSLVPTPNDAYERKANLHTVSMRLNKCIGLCELSPKN